jgi:hypothetical protein
MQVWRALLLAAALPAAPAMAQFVGEHLAAPADPSFHLGFTSTSAGDMQEYVPAGETVENWTRMITVQRIGYRPGLTPMRFAQVWLAGLARACGVPAPQPTETIVAGHAAVDARFECPRNPQTGKPETVVARFVLGDEALHDIQAATRRAPAPADTAWSGRVVAGTMLCASTSPIRRCAETQQPKLGSAL